LAKAIDPQLHPAQPREASKCFATTSPSFVCLPSQDLWPLELPNLGWHPSPQQSQLLLHLPNCDSSGTETHLPFGQVLSQTCFCGVGLLHLLVYGDHLRNLCPH